MQRDTAILSGTKALVMRWKIPFIILILLMLVAAARIAYESYTEYSRVRNYMHLYEKAKEAVKTEATDAQANTKSDTIPKKGIIKDFDVEGLWKQYKKHIFSQKHLENGLSDIINKERELFDKIIDLVKRADKKGLLGETSTDIRTTINNAKVTVRVHIKNGKVMSVNCFPNQSNRVIYRLIEFE